jgi:hypothetical protein
MSILKFMDFSRTRISLDRPLTDAENTTPMMHVNRMFRENGHLFAYDYPTMAQALSKSGFSDVRRQSFRQGCEATLLIDSAEWEIESLYVEASA